MISVFINIPIITSSHIKTTRKTISNIFKKEFKLKKDIRVLLNRVLISHDYTKNYAQIDYIMDIAQEDYDKIAKKINDLSILLKVFKKIKKELNLNLVEIVNNEKNKIKLSRLIDNYQTFVLDILNEKLFKSKVFKIEFTFYEDFGRVSNIEIYQNFYIDYFRFSLYEKNRYMETIEYLNNDLRNYVFHINENEYFLFGYDDIIENLSKVKREILIEQKEMIGLKYVKVFRTKLKKALMEIIKEYMYNDKRINRNKNVFKYFQEISKIMSEATAINYLL